MDENKIVIVSDDSNVIAFEDITIKRDTVDRAEVADIENKINELEQQKVAIDDEIVALKAKILYAKKVIALADEQKANEVIESKEPADEVNEYTPESDSDIQDTIVEEEV